MRLPPPGNRTFAIAESGVLSAVGCVLYLCWYNPILYPVSVTLTPMPLTLLAYRYGARVGLAGLGCTAVSVAAFLGPPDAFLYLGLFGVLGFLTGWLLHLGTQPGRVLVLGSLAVTLYDVFAYYCLERFFGLEDSLAPLRAAFDSAVKGAVSWSSPEIGRQMLALQAPVAQFFDFPVALFFCIALLAFLANYVIATVVLGQMGVRLPLPPGLMMFRLPPLAGAAGVGVLAVGDIVRTASPSVVWLGYMNVAFLSLMFLALEGWSVFLCLLNLSSLGLGTRLLTMLLFLVLFPLWPVIGLADSLFDLRSLSVTLLD